MWHHVARWLTAQLPNTNVADVWIGWVGLAFTMLVAFAGLAYRLGRQTQALQDLKDSTTHGLADLKSDIALIEQRVETFLMRAWVDRGERGG